MIVGHYFNIIITRAGQYYNIIINRDIKHHNNQYQREIFSIVILVAQYVVNTVNIVRFFIVKYGIDFTHACAMTHVLCV